MAETTRCQNLVTSVISSAGDILLDTPNGHAITRTVPTHGTHASAKMYVDAAIANLVLVGTVPTSHVLTGVYFVNGAVVLPAPVLGALPVTAGMLVLLSGDIPAGMYTASSPTTFVLTRLLALNDAVFVVATNTIWFLQVGGLVAYTKPAGGNITVYPTTSNLAAVIAGPGTFILSAGVYVLAGPVRVNTDTTLIGYGAKLVCADSMALVLENTTAVTVLGVAITGAGIRVSGSQSVVLRDCSIASADIGVWVSGSTNCTLDNVSVLGAGQVGVLVDAATHVLVRGSVITGSMSAAGIRCEHASANVAISQCVVADTDTGIHLAKCNAVTIGDSHIHRNTTGVIVSALPDGATGCVVGGLIMQNTTGVYVLGADRSNVLVGHSRQNTAVNICGSIDCGGVAGNIQILPTQVVPAGWLLCDGTAYSKSVYADLYQCIGDQFGASATTFNVPDLRGMFVRGHVPAAAREFATVQLDAFKAHTHNVAGAGLAASAAGVSAVPSINTYTAESTEPGILLPVVDMCVAGDTETRPINMNLNYIIKY